MFFLFVFVFYTTAGLLGILLTFGVYKGLVWLKGSYDDRQVDKVLAHMARPRFLG